MLEKKFHQVKSLCFSLQKQMIVACHKQVVKDRLWLQLSQQRHVFNAKS